MRKPTFRERIFQAWWRMQRPATLGVRGVVVDKEGKVLLLRHTYTPGWHFPGGGVERGETCGRSLLRELQEEAGIQATLEALELVSVHANHAFFPDDHVLVYRITAWTQGEPSQRGEIAEIRFVDALDPPQGVSGGTARRLSELFRRTKPSDVW